jgi:hypothetical protein
MIAVRVTPEAVYLGRAVLVAASLAHLTPADTLQPDAMAAHNALR